MDTERLYQVYGHYIHTKCPIDCVIRVKMGENIIEKANDGLTEAFGGGRPCISTIIEEIPKCEGCRIDACGQRDHMEHPDGCLHQPSDCEFCQMELKNLIRLSDANNKDNNGQT